MRRLSVLLAIGLCRCAAAGPESAEDPAPESSAPKPALTTKALQSPTVEPETITRFRYAYTYAMNRHGPMPHGARNTRSTSAVALELGSSGSARIVDAGEEFENVLAETYRKEETTNWRQTWTGRWVAEGEDGMKLSLNDAGGACTHTTEWIGQPAETKDCPPEPAAIELDCVRTDVDVDGAPTMAWVCHPGVARPSGTVTAWVFGLDAELDGCVLGTRGGRGRQSYRRCP